MIVPKYLYKFKPMKSAIDMCRFEQILCDSCIYMPNIHKLNDPLESMTYKITLGIAGGSYTTSCGHEHPIVADAKNRYRVLSLSKDIHSPLMWAHYADDYTGICFIFSSKKTFTKAKQVQYTNQAKYLDEGDFVELDDVAYESLFEKRKDWAYEKEWRLVEKSEPGLLHFDKDELIGIVVGHKMPQEMSAMINKKCTERRVPCFTTSVLQYDSQIVFFPIDLETGDFYEFGYLRDEVKANYTAHTYKLFAELNRKQMEKWKACS